MERASQRSLATFFAADELVAGRTATLGAAEAHHARVRRIGVGEPVELLDGAGHIARGVLIKLSKAQAAVQVDVVERVDPLPDVHLMVPVADRDRMLWLAEKATELGVSSWRPTMWRRSRSVSPRGEGVTFQAKVRARMASALTQSRGAWLPLLHPDATLDRAIAAAPLGARFLLDATGEPLLTQSVSAPLTIAVGPEGGIEPEERNALVAAGFVPASLGTTTLRFETAAIAALAIVRSALAIHLEQARG
ncbi:MAG TPA: RsmE family RNA methyltransferase [Gemmatimonadaceae bacterium]|nr:RsmE family RNA methyltransferase [Gemmatimonadaceae bacterium]